MTSSMREPIGVIGLYDRIGAKSVQAGGGVGNALDPDHGRSAGLTYEGIGRG